MSPEALGAILSGVAAVLSALISLRFTRKRTEAECARRISEIKQAFREGLELGGQH
jgi:hypothetical protein